MKQEQTGKIKFFEHARGFGFIKADGTGEEYFFHFSKQVDPNDRFWAGEEVTFDVIENRKGLCAINVARNG